MHHIQAIDLLELLCLGKGRTGHAAQLGVQAEEILERNGRQRHAFCLYRHLFLGFDCLVEPFRVAAAMHQAAGVFIHNNYFAIVRYHVVFIALE